MQVVDANGNMYGDDNLEINDINGKPKTTGGGGSSSLTVGTTPIASGTIGRILFENGSNLLGQDSALFWDNTNKRLGVGATPSTAVRLDVRAQGALVTDIALRVRNSADTADLFQVNGLGNSTLNSFNLGGGVPAINIQGVGVNVNPYLQVSSDGNTSYARLIAARNAGTGGVTPTGVNRAYLFLNNGGGSHNVIGSNDGLAFSAQGHLSYDSINDQMRLKNGNLGIGTGYSASARLDIKAQGALSTDIALRVRNSANTDNIAEFSGNASVYLGLASNRKISINGANNQIMVGNLTTYTGYQHTLALKSYLRPSMIWEDANAVGARTELFYDSYSNTQLRTSLTTNVLNYANPYGSQAKLINVCGATPNITQNGGFFWYRDNSIEVTLPNRVAWLTPEHQFILYNSPSSNYVSNTDSFQLYSKDITAGNASPHFRTENGNIIKLYQQPTGGAASTFVVGVGTAVTDASTFDGYTLGQIVKALRNTGILA